MDYTDTALDDYNRILDSARDLAFEKLQFSQCSISGSRVGASIVARYNEGSIGLFGGCNLELSTSCVIHAEHVALMNALSNGCITIESVHVTSSNEKQRAALCGYCRQTFMYVNPDTMIYVYNPDKSLKIKVKLVDTLNYPYLRDSILKPVTH